MRRSLSLAAYLALARRAAHEPAPPATTRPDGELVWAHATEPAHLDALQQLAERLAMHRPGLHMLITSRDFSAEPLKSKIVMHEALPPDTVPAAKAFLDHWRPDICLWTGGDLQPAFITEADARDVPLYLIDAEETLLEKSSWRWFPDMPRALLGRFALILSRSANTARFLRRLGVKDAEISVTGPFQEGALALPYSESDREELATLLRGRPVWLAAMLQLPELDAVLEAHQAVSRLAHRALLVVVPDEPDDGPAFRDRLEQDGRRHVVWSQGAMPEETTQVLLADTYGEMGLWYRLAPITFMGSSLQSGQWGRDPNEPAAHGSAILYGPYVRRYLSSYTRFAEAGAARIVRDAETLGTAVKRLIPADQSAAMAHAAWDVASQSAGVTDKILDLVQDTLDIMEAR
ncbi:3-deoxy-D-manno-octulosonic-acid transferase [Roseovarius halotolerans]|uniref:3-deoxy-D-manno-octulosonic acid transferase n=1 Tax=Roseovarius halotolerans TaxID=505353 RepID=A0A1X6YZX7_9RHOB|nr:glycosyltransferase N-terminal domain-containing protein [Roseovarius halotolerans]RKT32512.1 3-deoxy-D-manno-octulosonic-acid transferase [Roseovarius halotolerans]SLN36297.1 3-deoxy-D-manno-octulosonic acid transferase [Roseovarius halotolerans]